MSIPTMNFGRRRFLQTLGASALASFPALGAAGANERIRLGVIGCGGRGTGLLKQFHAIRGAEVVALADPDTAQMDRALSAMKDSDFKPARYQDYRKLLDSKDIDAVIIASPNHWHALHTIHSCQAGKDVYVEKPVTYKMEEAASMRAAAAKYGRMVQAGTQNRSDRGLIEAFDFIRSGDIGEITAIRGLCYRNRSSIGPRRKTPLTPPPTVDYDLWLGPAQDLPIMRDRFHYDWHWVWNTGNGDIGNQAPHEFDLMTWVLGDPPLPAEVRSFGQRFAWNDAGETPNIQTSWFELGGVPAVFEVNNLRVKPETNAAVAFEGIRVGVIVTCEGGEFRGGRGGGYVVGPDGKERIRKFPGDAGGDHARNFLDAVRSRKADSLAAKLSPSCDSAAIAHLGNISYLAGETLSAKRLREGALASSPTLLEVLDRQEAQLEKWSIPAGDANYVLGAPVSVDPAKREVTGELAGTAIANRPDRPTFALPKEV